MRHRRIVTHFRHRPFEVDPYFGSVVLLLPFEGQNGVTSPADKSRSAKTMTAGGSGSPAPQILKRRSKWSNGSWWTGAAIDDHLTTPDSADFSFGTADFDIRADLLLIFSATDVEILAQRAGADNNNFWFIRRKNDGTLRFIAKTAGVTITDLTTTAVFPFDGNSFTTLHVRRRSGVLQVAFDGIQQTLTGTDGPGAWPDAPSPLIIGNGDDSYSNGVNAYFSYLRITKGVSREFSANWRLRMRQPLPVY